MASPIPTELANRPGVPALESATRSDIGRLMAIPHDVSAALAGVRKVHSDSRGNADLSQEGRLRLQESARSAAQARIGSLQTEAVTLFDKVSGIASIAQRPTVIRDVSQALLDEMQTSKAWARVERRLNGVAPELLGREAGVIAQEAAAAADEITLRSLWAELPSYLFSRKAGYLADVARAQLLGYSNSFLPPSFVAAQAVLDAVEQNRQIYGFLFSSSSDRAAGDGGISGSAICVGWDSEVIK